MRSTSAGSERSSGPRASVAFAASPPPAAAAAPPEFRGSAVAGGAASGKARPRSGSLAAALQCPTSLLRETPPNCPPALTNRTATDAELFQFYSLRGHVEVLGASSAAVVRAALGELTKEERKLAMAAHTHALEEGPAAVRDGDGGKVSSQTAGDGPVGGRADAFPERHPVPPPKPTDLACPHFPRLRPSAANDKRPPAEVKAQRESERFVEVRERQTKAALPPVEVYYTALYRPTTDLTASMEAGMSDALSHAASTAVVNPLGTTAGGQGPHAGGPKRPAGNASHQSMSVTTMAAAGQSYSPATPPSTTGFAVSHSSPQRAALLHENHAFLAQEVDDLFVAVYYQTHPKELEKKQAEEEMAARRRSTKMATAAMEASSGAGSRGSVVGSHRKSGAKKRKSAVEKAPKHRDGEPAENLRYLKASLLSLCDEEGHITGTEVEGVFTNVPFELKNTDALRDLMQIIRRVTEAKQREFDTVAAAAAAAAATASAMAGNETRGLGASLGNAAGGGVGMENSLSGTSRRGLHPGASTHSQQQHDGSGRIYGSGVAANSSLRRTIGASPSVTSHGSNHTNANNNSNNNNNNNTSLSLGAAGASLSGYPRSSLSLAAGGAPAVPAVTSAAPTVTRVLFREILGALNALVNGGTTRMIVRWVCFETLAAEGQGYIHKATLQALRTKRREECEGPQADFTASIVKALDDAFDKMAAEEEAEYIQKNTKGKRKAKAKKGAAAVKLAPNQKSVIPPGVMRRAHMDFTEFCRYFDELPQLCAAFLHVWLGLLLNGRIGAADSEPAVAALVEANSPTHGRRVSKEVVANAGITQRRARVSVSSLGAGGGSVEDGEGDQHPSFGAAATPSAPSAPVGDSPAISTTAVSPTSGFPQSSTPRGRNVGDEVKPGTFPLTLLGTTNVARRVVIQNVVHKELALLREAMESRRLSMTTPYD